MTSGVKPIPEGYHSVTPYLVVNDAAGAIEFYKKAFGASELMRMPAPGGKVGHAEIEIGDSRIMLADEFPEMGARSARTIGGSPVHLHLYVEDVDAVTRQGARGRREGAPAGQGPVLRRPLGQRRGPLRPRLARLDPQGGRAARRAEAARRAGDASRAAAERRGAGTTAVRRWNDFGRVRCSYCRRESEQPRPESLTPVQASAGSR